tara:strand:+ start:83 stop:817 length:735 start_codon:yes stop_codon:yes gene_type:complete
MKRGVLYIAFGAPFMKELKISAESVKKHNPDLHITVFTDQPFECEFVDDVKIVSVRHLRPKIDYIKFSPYEESLFLDTDTVINHSLDDLYGILEKYDLALVHDLARKRKKFKDTIPEYGDIPYSFSEINTGVIAFRKNQKVKELFEQWRLNFYKYYNVVPWDQPSFRISVWNSDATMYVLPPEYNCRSIANREKQDRFHHEFGEEHLKTRIFHMHADTRINQGTYEVESLEEALEFCKNNHMRY